MAEAVRALFDALGLPRTDRHLCDTDLRMAKLARAVEAFARRPQVQERLTQQLAEFLEERLQARGVIVLVEARHLCMEMRGVRRHGVVTTTTSARGGFSDPGLRREFLARISLSAGASPHRRKRP